MYRNSTIIEVVFVLFVASTVVHATYSPTSWDEAYQKAETIVSRMSIEQKVGVTTGIGWKKSLCVGNTHSTTEPYFPSLCLQDAPVGISYAHNVTVGVAGISTTASFDKKLFRSRAEYMGREFRGKGINVQLGPVLNMLRVPSAGRNWESGGEDPYLVGVYGYETVKGIQDQGVIACAKHFLLNEQELHRFISSSEVDSRTLHEIYLWPFARSIEAGIGAIMCSYNMVNGTYACENNDLINTILKEELGFRGFVVSDWTATKSTSAANKGLDMNMPGNITMKTEATYFGQNLTDAVYNKTVTETRLTDMTMRIVATWFKMRQDELFPDIALNTFHIEKSPFIDVQENHKEMVRELGAASNVLLKNVNNALPIRLNELTNIAIIGSDAGPNPYGLNCEANGCTGGTLAQGWGSGTAYFPYIVDPLKGLNDAFGGKVDIKYTLNDWDLNYASKIAEGADYAFVFSNSNSGEGHIIVEDNAGDRNNISLWNNGDNLIKATADSNNNTVVVIHSVGPILMPWIDHPNITAILWPGLPGQESGNSLADVITGKVNPSGRLPYTIAKRLEDYNVHIDPRTVVKYSEKLLLGYKWFDHAKIEPLFPFGYGLSYTRFKYSELKIETNTSVVYEKSHKVVHNISVVATTTIENYGYVDGAEVAQLYLSFPKNTGSPPKQLRGFERVFLKHGTGEKVMFELGKNELSIWDITTNTWTVPFGRFTIYVGASSRDIREFDSFTI